MSQTITKVTPKLLKTIKRQLVALGDVVNSFDSNQKTREQNHAELITATQVAVSELADALVDHLPEAQNKLREALANGDVVELRPTLVRAILEALEGE